MKPNHDKNRDTRAAAPNRPYLYPRSDFPSSSTADPANIDAVRTGCIIPLYTSLSLSRAINFTVPSLLSGPIVCARSRAADPVRGTVCIGIDFLVSLCGTSIKTLRSSVAGGNCCDGDREADKTGRFPVWLVWNGNGTKHGFSFFRRGNGWYNEVLGDVGRRAN